MNGTVQLPPCQFQQSGQAFCLDVQILADHVVGDTGIRLLPNYVNCGPIPLDHLASDRIKGRCALGACAALISSGLGLPIPGSRARLGTEIQVVVYGVGGLAVAEV